MNGKTRKLRQIASGCMLALPLIATGCYHATIETGRAPSGQTVENEWAHSFIGGLIPPSTVNTAAECPNGVATVETQHSILNLVAQIVTFSLYSPMTITVQCAASGMALGPVEGEQITLPEGASRAELAQALNRAAAVAADEGEPVTVRFSDIQ